MEWSWRVQAVAKRTERAKQRTMLVQSLQVPEVAGAGQSFPALLGKVVAAQLKRSLKKEVEME